MASQAENDCLSNPNFAVICSFLDRYGESLSLPDIGYSDLQEWIEDTKNVSPVLIDLHVRLLRRIHKKLSNVTADRWERGIVKFCHKYSSVDAWEMERFGYKLAKISTKLTLLKNLMENQFDFNSKFKDKVNEIPIENMRFQPIGRDKTGMAYWYFLDKELNLRVYREHQDDVDSESWELVCRTRDDLAKLIYGLHSGNDTKSDKPESSDQSEPVSDNNEDSRDSFKQKTPLGPSPLTVKQEPKEASSPAGGLKSNALQKVYKVDSQSPSKMLKDKFLKVKGSEIQKIMCKMKQEGIVDSDSDENTHKTKKDEVDGTVNDTDGMNTVKEEPKDSFVVDIVRKENVPEKGTAGNAIQTEENVLDNDRMLNDNESIEIGKSVEDEIPRKPCENKESIGQELKENKKIDDLDIDEDNKDIEILAKKKIKSDYDETEESLSEPKMLGENRTVEQMEPEITESIKESEHSGKGQPPNIYEVQNDLSVVKEDMQVAVKSDDKVIDEKETELIVSEISSAGKVEPTANDETGPKEIHEKRTVKDCESEENNPKVDNSLVTENNSKSSPNAEQNTFSENALCEERVEKETPSGDLTEIECEDILKDTSDRTVNDDEMNKTKDSVCNDPKDKIHKSEIEKITNCEVITKEIKIENPQIVDNNEESADSYKVAIPSAMKKSEVTDLNLVNERQSKDEEKLDEESIEPEESVDNKDTDKMMKSVSEATEIPKKARKRKQDEITATPNSCTEDEVHLELPTKRNVISVVRKRKNSFANDLTGINNTNECPKSDEIEDKNDINLEAENKSCEINLDEKSDDKNATEKIETADNIKENEESCKKCVETDKENEMEDTGQSDNIKPDDSSDKDEVIKENVKIATPTAIKGLVQIKKKLKAQKRQAADSDEIEPVEPAIKRSKLRGRVSSHGRGTQRGANYDSSSTSEDDLPLSQVAGRGRGSHLGGKRKSEGKFRRVPNVKSKSAEAGKNMVDKTAAEQSDDETGRRRSLRVRNMRARKKSPSPDYVPSELEESDDDFLDDDDEFTVKSKKKKKKEHKEVVVEVPKGRNALRHEEKAKKKAEKKVEETEAACVKCLRSHQPEWILLCDKCDAGYHTACLRPPLMIIPDGDWFCPPCEHDKLKENLEESLKKLDEAILKNDRLVRRKERLAFVSISLDNVLKEPEVQPKQDDRKQKKLNYKESDVESETGSNSCSGSSGSSSESESYSEGENITRSSKSFKQKFVQRSCRTKKSVSYRFEEYDELIMDAIEEDLSIPKEPKQRKVKPPGISRGKDMSNILGASDEETEKKPIRKRKPRLTELDEDIDDDDDDTDDYQLSDASNASDATKSSEPYESEDVSEDSIETSCRKTRRGQRKSQRKGGRNMRFKDFIVESDFESNDDRRSRSGRKQRKRVNYKEVNSDETEVGEDSFHSSELSDSDFEYRRRKRIQKSKKVYAKKSPRSGKRQRIRRVSSSSESEEESDSDNSTPKKNIGKKPPQKSARYDSEDTEESDDDLKPRNAKSKKFKELSDDSVSVDNEETTESDVSEEGNVLKVAAKKKFIESETEEEKDEEKEDDKRSESHETNSSSGDESGWEEIGIGSGEEMNIQTSVKKARKKGEDKTSVKRASNIEDISNQEKEVVNNSSDVTQVKEVSEKDGNKLDIVNEEPQKIESDETVEEEMTSDIVVTPTKKKRGRNPKQTQGDSPTVTPKKRGRKPKTDLTEATGEDLSLKKKYGRKKKCENETIPESLIEDSIKQVHKETKIEFDNSGEKEEKKETEESTEVLKSQEDSSIEKNESSPTHEKAKDDSPLSARNKQNAPVGIVKPEVRQGVIVENKQVIEGRMNEGRTGDTTVNPLQGMRDLAMGSQPMHGGHESSFTPYSQANYSGPNMQGYMPHQGFHNYHPSPSYGPQGPPGPSPYSGHQGMLSEGPHPRPQPPSQYHQNQSSVSPNSFQPSGSYLNHMQQGPQGYYPGNFRPQVAIRPDVFNLSNSEGPQGTNFQGQFPPNYPNQGTYHGHLRHGYPEHHGSYPVGPQGSQQGPYHSGMPYSMQGTPRHGFWPQGGSQGPSPGPQPVRPQSRPPPCQPQGVSPTSRGEGAVETPNRGFMMDNILKPAPEGGSNDVEDSAEVSDIDRYTSFLCKTE